MTTVATPPPGQAESPPPRFLRIWFSISLLVALAMMVGVGWWARRYEEIFKQLEMHQLPLPTEGMLALGRFVRTTGGVVTVVAVGLILTMLAAKGALDKVLVKLVVINCIFISLIIPFAVFPLHSPVAQIQRKLSE